MGKRGKRKKEKDKDKIKLNLHGDKATALRFD
jgi:hypothetical protein